MVRGVMYGVGCRVQGVGCRVLGVGCRMTLSRMWPSCRGSSVFNTGIQGYLAHKKPHG